MRAFSRVAIIGLGLIGSSVARAIKAKMPGVTVTGHDADPQVRETARALQICDDITDNPGTAVIDADLVMLCVPVRAMASAAADFADDLPDDVIISDVGSCKAQVAAELAKALPNATIIPAHPVAGTEYSGPQAGFAELFEGRWCIVTPPADAPAGSVEKVSALWEAIGARVEIMDAEHHDLVLAVTSHLPHLIAYTIVGTASDLEQVTESEVIQYSAGGFRDFTRIAASDPVMWRDVFLSNKAAVLEMLGRFTEDLTALQRAIRNEDGDALQAHFTRTRAIRRGIVEQGQARSQDKKPEAKG